MSGIKYRILRNVLDDKTALDALGGLVTEDPEVAEISSEAKEIEKVLKDIYENELDDDSEIIIHTSS